MADLLLQEEAASTEVANGKRQMRSSPVPSARGGGGPGRTHDGTSAGAGRSKVRGKKKGLKKRRGGGGRGGAGGSTTGDRTREVADGNKSSSATAAGSNALDTVDSRKARVEVEDGQTRADDSGRDKSVADEGGYSTDASSQEEDLEMLRRETAGGKGLQRSRKHGRADGGGAERGREDGYGGRRREESTDDEEEQRGVVKKLRLRTEVGRMG